MSKPARAQDESTPPFGKPSKLTDHGLLVRLTGTEARRAAPNGGMDYGRWYALWRDGWVTHEECGSVVLTGGHTVAEAKKDAQLHGAPAKLAPFGERPGLHYKAHLARARLKDPTLSERELGREIWPGESVDCRRGKIRNIGTNPDTITTIAAHFGVAPESFYAPIEAAGE